MNKSIKILAFILILVSCKKTSIEERNKYQIVSMLYNTLAKPIEPFFPPALSNKPFTVEDSIRILKMIKNSKEKIKNTQFRVAVDPSFKNKVFIENRERINKYLKINKSHNDFKSLKEEKIIEISKIKNNRKDSIILFSENLLTKGTKEFVKFDYFISFSPVVFNKNYNKAVVAVSGARSKLAGAIVLYYLIKKDNKWMVYNEKVLQIS